jgi:hypothetical protein
MISGLVPYVPPQAEVILRLPSPIKPIAHVRSAFILGSIAGMKESGHYDAYLRVLPEQHRMEILTAVAGTWLPVATAVAHYRACDKLGLGTADASRRGRAAFERLGGIAYGTALQMARQAGATPWTFLPSLQRFWGRAYDGGALAVYKLGPKDARIDLLASSLCEVPYYRHALGGLLEGLVSLFCKKVYLRDGRQPDGAESASFRTEWV